MSGATSAARAVAPPSVMLIAVGGRLMTTGRSMSVIAARKRPQSPSSIRSTAVSRSPAEGGRTAGKLPM
jgi:hypothetical protein